MNLLPTFDLMLGWQITLTLLNVGWIGLIVAALAAIGNSCLRAAPASRRYDLNFAAMLALGLTLPVTLMIVRQTTRQPADPPEVASIPSSTVHSAADVVPVDRVAPVWTHAALWRDVRETSPYIALLYVCGAAAMLARLLISVYGGRRLRAACRPVADVGLLQVVARQSRRLGMRLAPTVCFCERVAVPVVLGVLRPMILLPASILTQLDPEQLAAVLTHELAHIRRCDHALLLVQRLIEALLFFHPAVWYLSRRVHHERESCCDDLVLTAGGDRLIYCLSLLRVAELRLASENQTRQLTALAVDGKQPSRLRRRIARLLGQADVSAVALPRAGLLAGALLALLAGGVLFSLPRPEKPVHSPISLVPGRSDKVVTAEVIDHLGIGVAAVAQPVPRSLRLSGTLALEPNRLARVRSQFNGEVVEIGSLVVEGIGEPSRRELRYGDHVHKGDLLSVVSSVEIRSPIDGIIVERNVSPGEIIDRDHVLFQIADLSQLLVIANISEEDLPRLRSLPADKRRWKIHLKSDPNGKPLEGTFDSIGQIIDLGSHMAVVWGYLDNKESKFAAGQFITATIELPAELKNDTEANAASLKEEEVNVAVEPTQVAGKTLTITIRSAGDGRIASMTVGLAKLFDCAVDADRLRALDRRLKDVLAIEGTIFDQVLLRVDTALNYDELVKVIDVCTRQKMADGRAMNKISFMELPGK